MLQCNQFDTHYEVTIMKKVNIVGAGIAGLSAGCYLQMNGYDTQIFEAHNLPGGVCTSWKRKGYTIDNCIHCLPSLRIGEYDRGNKPVFEGYELSLIRT
jgi:phytoene dehydrogenase-like protein